MEPPTRFRVNQPSFSIIYLHDSERACGNSMPLIYRKAEFRLGAFPVHLFHAYLYPFHYVVVSCIFYGFQLLVCKPLVMRYIYMCLVLAFLRALLPCMLPQHFSCRSAYKMRGSMVCHKPKSALHVNFAFHFLSFLESVLFF